LGEFPEERFAQKHHLIEPFLSENLSLASSSWIQYGVFTNRAILSYGGPFNGLGPGSNWPQSSLDVFLEEGAMRAQKSLRILEQHLKAEEWLALGRPTIADLSVFVYVALAPIGDISLEPYPKVREWIGRIQRLGVFLGLRGWMIRWF
jgi:glutathione S-transferase